MGLWSVRRLRALDPIGENETPQEMPMAPSLILIAVTEKSHPPPPRELFHRRSLNFWPWFLMVRLRRSIGPSRKSSLRYCLEKPAPEICCPGCRAGDVRFVRDRPSRRHTARPAGRAHEYGLREFEGHQPCD